MLLSILLTTLVNASLQTLDLENRYCGNNVNIFELSTETAHRYFSDNVLTPRMLVMCYLKRIRLMNRELGNIIEINKDAKEEAEKLSLKGRIIDKPLYGIPVIISGNIMTNDSMSTRLGKENIKEREKGDAVVVKLLREAGAIIVGKARGNVRQFSNPYNLRHKNAGCSAGSAIASNLAMLAVSVEPDAFSLTSASELSLTAIKLTRDDVRMTGILVTSPFESSIVALARNVIDCFKLFKVLSIEGQAEPKNLTEPLKKNSYLQTIFTNQFTKVVGFAKDNLFGYFHRTQISYIRELKKRLRENGIQAIEDLDIPLESKECLRSSSNYFRSSLAGSASLIEHILTSLPCSIDEDLKAETMEIIETSINSSKADALILPYPVVAFLPQLPVMTIPSGHVEDGIPYGITLCTRKIWSANLFNIAFRIEQKEHSFRYRPSFLS